MESDSDFSLTESEDAYKIQDGSFDETLSNSIGKSRYGRTRKPKVLSNDFYDIDIILDTVRESRKIRSFPQPKSPLTTKGSFKQKVVTPPEDSKEQKMPFIHVTADSELDDDIPLHLESNNELLTNSSFSENDTVVLEDRIETVSSVNITVSDNDGILTEDLVAPSSSVDVLENAEPKSNSWPAIKTYSNKRKCFNKTGGVETFGLPDTTLFPLENVNYPPTEPILYENLDVSCTPDSDINLVDKSLANTPWKIASMNVDLNTAEKLLDPNYEDASYNRFDDDVLNQPNNLVGKDVLPLVSDTIKVPSVKENIEFEKAVLNDSIELSSKSVDTKTKENEINQNKDDNTQSVEKSKIRHRHRHSKKHRSRDDPTKTHSSKSVHQERRSSSSKRKHEIKSTKTTDEKVHEKSTKATDVKKPTEPAANRIASDKSNTKIKNTVFGKPVKTIAPVKTADSTANNKSHDTNKKKLKVPGHTIKIFDEPLFSVPDGTIRQVVKPAAPPSEPKVKQYTQTSSKENLKSNKDDEKNKSMSSKTNHKTKTDSNKTVDTEHAEAKNKHKYKDSTKSKRHKKMGNNPSFDEKKHNTNKKNKVADIVKTVQTDDEKVHTTQKSNNTKSKTSSDINKNDVQNNKLVKSAHKSGKTHSRNTKSSSREAKTSEKYVHHASQNKGLGKKEVNKSKASVETQVVVNEKVDEPLLNDKNENIEKVDIFAKETNITTLPENPVDSLTIENENLTQFQRDMTEIETQIVEIENVDILLDEQEIVSNLQVYDENVVDIPETEVDNSTKAELVETTLSFHNGTEAYTFENRAEEATSDHLNETSPNGTMTLEILNNASISNEQFIELTDCEAQAADQSKDIPLPLNNVFTSLTNEIEIQKFNDIEDSTQNYITNNENVKLQNKELNKQIEVPSTVLPYDLNDLPSENTAACNKPGRELKVILGRPAFASPQILNTPSIVHKSSHSVEDQVFEETQLITSNTEVKEHAPESVATDSSAETDSSSNYTLKKLGRTFKAKNLIENVLSCTQTESEVVEISSTSATNNNADNKVSQTVPDISKDVSKTREYTPTRTSKRTMKIIDFWSKSTKTQRKKNPQSTDKCDQEITNSTNEKQLPSSVTASNKIKNTSDIEMATPKTENELLIAKRSSNRIKDKPKTLSKVSSKTKLSSDSGVSINIMQEMTKKLKPQITEKPPNSSPDKKDWLTCIKDVFIDADTSAKLNARSSRLEDKEKIMTPITRRSLTRSSTSPQKTRHNPKLSLNTPNIDTTPMKRTRKPKENPIEKDIIKLSNSEVALKSNFNEKVASLQRSVSLSSIHVKKIMTTDEISPKRSLRISHKKGSGGITPLLSKPTTIAKKGRSSLSLTRILDDTLDHNDDISEPTKTMQKIAPDTSPSKLGEVMPQLLHRQTLSGKRGRSTRSLNERKLRAASPGYNILEHAMRDSVISKENNSSEGTPQAALSQKRSRGRRPSLNHKDVKNILVPDASPIKSGDVTPQILNRQISSNKRGRLSHSVIEKKLQHTMSPGDGILEQATRDPIISKETNSIKSGEGTPQTALPKKRGRGRPLSVNRADVKSSFVADASPIKSADVTPQTLNRQTSSNKRGRLSHSLNENKLHAMSPAYGILEQAATDNIISKETSSIKSGQGTPQTVLPQKRGRGRPPSLNRKDVGPLSLNHKDVKSTLDKLNVDSTKIKVGDIMWARISSYPYWPCLVMEDPISNIFQKNIATKHSHTKKLIHVRFYGDNGRRCWISALYMLRFETKNDLQEIWFKNSTKYNKRLIGNSTMRSNWEIAIDEALTQKSNTIKERLNFFTSLIECDTKVKQKKRLSSIVKEENEMPKSRASRATTPVNTARTERSKSLPASYRSPRSLEEEKKELPKSSVMRKGKTSPLPKFAQTHLKVESSPVHEEPQDSPVKNIDPDLILSAKVEKLTNDVQSEVSLSGSDFSKSSSSTPIPDFGDLLTRQKRNNLFKGVQKHRVCQICKKFKDIFKCQGPCNGLYHLKCAKEIVVPQNQDHKIEAISPNNCVPATSVSSTNSHCSTLNEVVEINSEKNSATPNCSVEEQIDLKMKEVMSLQETYADSTTDYTSSEENLAPDATLKTVTKKKSYCAKDISTIEIYGGNIIELPHVAKSIEDTPKPELMTSNPASVDALHNDFKCNYCLADIAPPCFSCGKEVSKAGDVLRQKCSMKSCGRFYHPDCVKDWPQTQWSLISTIKHKDSDKDLDTFVCPAHVCHTCTSDNPHTLIARCPNNRVVKCLRCPVTYHTGNYCVPAGTHIFTTSQIICPRHIETMKEKHCKNMKLQTFNSSWCFICSVGGKLICCETCPTSVHPECVKVNLRPDGIYICEDCETGRYPLYDEIVWVKLGNFRWWPATILFPSEIPTNILNVKHNKGEFAVKFFGTHDYFWVHRGRVFLFQDGDKGHCRSAQTNLNASFKLAMEEAKEAHALKSAFASNRKARLLAENKPPPYIRIKSNKPVGNVKLFEANVSNTTPCECRPTDASPCGSESDCLNRMLLTECDPHLCPAGDKCQNQRFEKRQYPTLVPYKTESRGWGLKTSVPIPKGEFVIEYVGELIDDQEYQRRIHKMHETKDENYYFLIIDKDRIIDAGPKGNLARFMNHSCQPNCATQKWNVSGSTRVGLFAIQDIEEGSELTFNYQLQCVGKEKKICECGAPTCNGFIGGKSKLVESQKKVKKENNKRKRGCSAPPVSKAEGPCFICGRAGNVGACQNKICNKFYHLKCVQLQFWPEGKWVCPWHNCNICSKRTIRCCVLCINSYCPVHSENNVRYDKLLGFVCSEHDPSKESQELQQQIITPNRASTSICTEETDVTSTTPDDSEQSENKRLTKHADEASTSTAKKNVTNIPHVNDTEEDVKHIVKGNKVLLSTFKRKRSYQKNSVDSTPKKIKLTNVAVKPTPPYSSPSILDIAAHNEVKLLATVPTRHLRTTRKVSTESEIRQLIKRQSEYEKDLPIRKRTRPRCEVNL